LDALSDQVALAIDRVNLAQDIDRAWAGLIDIGTFPQDKSC
jgi:hypothetical protein